MIRHHAFFETLGAAEEKSPDWNVVFAGLSTLRLVDRLTADPESEQASPSELDATRAAIEAVSPGDPVRAILSRIVGRLSESTELTHDLGSDVMTYGRALDLQGLWTLAADVFQSVAAAFSERAHPRIIIEASTALGAAARNSGDWETSKHAYARAEHLAERIGDHALALTARVGIATSHMVKGNLPAAEAELDEVLAQANAERIESVQAIALHARASVAHSRRDYQQAIHLAYRSLELTTNPSARERLLADIAAAYADLGMRETARTAYSIVALTSPHQWVRWQSTLNLIELAILDGDEEAFESYFKQIEGATLDPKLQSYALYFRALGHRKFARQDADQLFNEAQSFAEAHELNQLAFEIERARTTAPVSSASVSPSNELLQIAEMIEHLRDRVSIESG
jgi:tetratricopeptide (TPR) repeat protein